MCALHYYIVTYAEKPSDYGDEIWLAAAAMLIAPLIAKYAIVVLPVRHD